MSSHLEVSKPSGRELIPLTGQRVTLGKASTNVVSLEHDATVSRLHAIFENHRVRLVDTRCGQSQRHLLNGEKITAERVLRSGDEVRVGKSRLVYLEVKDSRRHRSKRRRSCPSRPAPAAADPARTRRAHGVVPAIGLRRPVSRARIGSADGGRAVRHRGSRQTAPAEPLRQVRHPHRGRPPGASGQRGASARRRHNRPAARQRARRTR